MNKNIYFKRGITVLIFFNIIFAVLFFRIKLKTVDEAYELSVRADSQYNDKANVSDLNYLLFDSNGKEMLQYKKRYYAVIDPSSFAKNNLDSKSDDLYALIYTLRNYDNSYDLSNIGFINTSQKKTYTVDEETYNKLKQIKGVKGFYAYSDSYVDRAEAWKIENLLTNTQNPLDGSFKSEDSLEMQVYNKTKNNQYPMIKVKKDLDGNVADEEFVKPSNNVNVRLTVDKNIQDKVKEVLNNDKNKKYDQVGVIVMEADNGKIKAMAQKDDTKPNVNLGSATENGFNPGSIFKTIVEEAGLDRKTLSLSDKFVCQEGVKHICKTEHGTLSVEQAFILSCNDAFAEIGDEKVGFNNFMDNAQTQGLFNKVLNFQSEVKGDFTNPIKNAGGARFQSIGQSIRITPIQAISIANTVVNNGIYVKPYLIDAFVNDDNKEIEKLNTNYHATIEKNTANIMKDQMKKVVKYGTGTAANIDKMEVGGKTGTSTRVEGKVDGKEEYHSDGWFVGYFKVNNKYYSMVVFVKDIDIEKESGGNTAAPIFKEVVEAIKQYI